ncbi:MAG: hypothetical protein A2Z04_05175 [Chloroflexi bacterium RBG_16_57_9]|nr:MAG: hypothetical protein A2Z04_05175 [Chloroflexi bacterium RBG_16_57_9]
MDKVITWLLEGSPWVQYRARVDLLHQPEDDLQVRAARQAMLAHPQVQGLLAELAAWPGRILNSHKDAGHPLHKLTFIADLGLQAGDPGVDRIIAQILDHQSPAGPFQVLMNIHPRYGGTGEDQWAWALCDAPLLLYALLKFGLGEDPRVQTAAQYLVSLIRDNGWPCAVSPESGKFRGPGRKDDPCPYASLVMLKALAQMPEWRDSQACRTGAETLLTLWTQSRDRHPYLFYMGTDFRKLKAPLVWYDILHVLDVLTQFPWLREDARLREMVDMVKAKADAQGRFTPESVWKAWGEWDFGQKREPSRWLTLLVWRIQSM